MTIKNINDLKKIQIVCRNQEQVKNCLNYLKQLGFDVEDFTGYCDGCNIIFWGYRSKNFFFSNMLKRNLPIEFYNKKLIKTLQKFIKEKEERKEEVKDFEIAEDGRFIKINNYKSEKEVFLFCDWMYREKILLGIIKDFNPVYLNYLLKYGLAFSTKEARDKAMFKSEIETKLKNIAERLNNGRKIDWEDNEDKFNIYYNHNNKKLDFDFNSFHQEQGVIYCLDKNFVKVATQEIGEDNLIKYFKES